MIQRISTSCAYDGALNNLMSRQDSLTDDAGAAHQRQARQQGERRPDRGRARRARPRARGAHDRQREGGRREQQRDDADRKRAGRRERPAAAGARAGGERRRRELQRRRARLARRRDHGDPRPAALGGEPARRPGRLRVLGPGLGRGALRRPARRRGVQGHRRPGQRGHRRAAAADARRRQRLAVGQHRQRRVRDEERQLRRRVDRRRPRDSPDADHRLDLRHPVQHRRRHHHLLGPEGRQPDVGRQRPSRSGQQISVDGMSFAVTGTPANGDDFQTTPS